MDLDTPLVLALVYMAVAVVARLVKKARQRQGERPMEHQPRVVPATRRPPETMDELLREMREQLGELGGIERGPVMTGGRGSAPGGESEEVEWQGEEAISLETVPQMVSLETDVVEAAPVDRGYDDGVHEIVRQRRADAESRNRAWRPADHKAFDARVRAVAPPPLVDATVTARRSTRQLRDAIIWKEILGPPLGWPDRDRR